MMGLYAAKSAVLVGAQMKLSHPAARLLVHMALECWDDDNPGGQEPRRYYARRESSAIALGFLAPDNASERAFQVVKRAIRELIAKGAIRRLRVGGSGRTAQYELLVDSSRPGMARVPNPPIPLHGHRTRGSSVTPSGGRV